MARDPPPIRPIIDAAERRAIPHPSEVLMLRLVPIVALIAASFLVLSCNDTVVRTGEITTQTNPDYIDEFPTYQTFSVLTSAQVNPPPDVPDIGDEQQAFNQQVNQLIIDAMTSEPVCLEYIPPDQTSETNQPDLWAANGLSRMTEGGFVYQCCGGWWWGWWGWYWDPCAYICSTWVEFDVGSMLIPVGFPVASADDPEIVFSGLAQAILDGQDIDAAIRFAVQEIFKEWPDQRTCPQ